MTDKLSLLVFSRNDIDDAIDLIKDMYDVADDIVLIDSSDKKIHGELLSRKSRMHLKKLRIFYVVPIGYPDPLRMWALKKCKYRWILLIDTDERLSPTGKNLIKDLISGTDSSAFAIKRYEEYRDDKEGDFFTWQTRLFRKTDVIFRGIVHEQPVVNGIVERASDHFHIEHMAELRGRSSSEYRKMEIFDRMSYGVASDRLLDYFSKVVIPKEGSMKEKASGKTLRALLSAYKKMTFKEDEKELSDFDYFWFFAVVDLGYRLKGRHYGKILNIYSERKSYIDRIRTERAREGSEEIFKIAQIVNSTGITQYLGLDSDGTIAKINRKYAKVKGGTDLLIRMLKERYEKGKRWLD